MNHNFVYLNKTQILIPNVGFWYSKKIQNCVTLAVRQQALKKLLGEAEKVLMLITFG